MPSVRHAVERALRSGELDETSPLSQVPSIGPYLAARAGTALRVAGRPATVRDFWRGTRRRADARDLVLRILQNDRANQCVSTRVAQSRRRTYHVGDVNQRGYEAFATLLNHARAHVHRGGAAYAPLAYRLPRRSVASRECGCKSLRECDASPLCHRSDDGRACVPESRRAQGFEGLRVHANQRESLTDAARVRSAARTRVTQAHRDDPDTRRDLQHRRSRTLSYARRGPRLWRRPGSRVRVPLSP